MSKKKINITSTIELDLKQYADKTIQEVKDEIEFVIKTTEREANNSLRDSFNSGVNLKFITVNSEITNKGLKGKVGVDGGESNIAAYFEFGTGLSARQILAPYPQWIKDIAYEFYETGKGTLKGKPYLYNNFLKNLERFKVKIGKITTTKNE